MTLFQIMINLDFLSNFIFIARGHAGSRRVTPEPTASLLMTEMSQYSKILQVRSWYSKHFSSSPMLCAYPTIFYPASALYLAFCAESITRWRLVMRRPLPMLGTIVANKYITGIFYKILKLQRNERIRKEYEKGIECIILEEGLRERLRVHRRIKGGVSNIIWGVYEYEWLSHYLSVLIANTNAMNLAGFSNMVLINAKPYDSLRFL